MAKVPPSRATACCLGRLGSSQFYLLEYLLLIYYLLLTTYNLLLTTGKGVFVLAAHTDPQVKADMAKTSDAQHPQWLSAPQQKVDSG
mgnify:CR=1 FL=1